MLVPTVSFIESRAGTGTRLGSSRSGPGGRFVIEGSVPEPQRLPPGETARPLHSSHRHVWPCELDLMAQLVGLAPSERWVDWKEEPFTSAGRSHISGWQKPLHGPVSR